MEIARMGAPPTTTTTDSLLDPDDERQVFIPSDNRSRDGCEENKHTVARGRD